MGFGNNIARTSVDSMDVLTYSPLQRVNRRYMTGEAEEPHWELRMSIVFFSLLSVIVVAALVLAMRGIHQK